MAVFVKRWREIAQGTLAALLLTAAAAQAAEPGCDFGQPHRQAPPETAQFAFLVGRFDVSLHAWHGDRWGPPRPTGAHWNGRYGLNGMAIYDEWYDPGPDDPTGIWGVNVRTFDPHAGLWKVMWISLPERQVQDLRAEMRGGILTLWQVYPDRPGWKAEFEITDADHWARVSYVKDPDADQWTPQYRLAATRIRCGS